MTVRKKTEHSKTTAKITTCQLFFETNDYATKLLKVLDPSKKRLQKTTKQIKYEKMEKYDIKQPLLQNIIPFNKFHLDKYKSLYIMLTIYDANFALLSKYLVTRQCIFYKKRF